MKLLAQGQRMANVSTWGAEGATGGDEAKWGTRTGPPTNYAVRICRVGSGLVSQNVQANCREVVSLARSVRPSRFVHPLPNRVLRFRGKGSQDP